MHIFCDSVKSGNILPNDRRPHMLSPRLQMFILLGTLTIAIPSHSCFFFSKGSKKKPPKTWHTTPTPPEVPPVIRRSMSRTMPPIIPGGSKLGGNIPVGIPIATPYVGKACPAPEFLPPMTPSTLSSASVSTGGSPYEEGGFTLNYNPIVWKTTTGESCASVQPTSSDYHSSLYAPTYSVPSAPPMASPVGSPHASCVSACVSPSYAPTPPPRLQSIIELMTNDEDPDVKRAISSTLKHFIGEMLATGRSPDKKTEIKPYLEELGWLKKGNPLATAIFKAHTVLQHIKDARTSFATSKRHAPYFEYSAAQPTVATALNNLLLYTSWQSLKQDRSVERLRKDYCSDLLDWQEKETLGEVDALLQHLTKHLQTVMQSSGDRSLPEASRRAYATTAT